MRRKISILLLAVFFTCNISPIVGNAFYMEDLIGEDGEEKIEEIEDIIVSEKTEKEKIKLDEAELEREVEKLKDSKDRLLKIELDGLEAYNIDIELPSKIIMKLYEDKISLELVTDKYKLEIPYNIFEDMDLKEDDIFKLKLDEIENRHAANKVKDSDAVKEALDIYFERTRGRVKTKYRDLRDEMTIEIDVKKLGNKDRLAIYLIDQEQIYLTGKIKEDIMKFKTKSLGEITIVESYIGYSDTKKHWGRDEIESMSAKNVAEEKGKDTFKPNDPITRGEFARMLVNLLEVELESYDNRFEDVKKTSAYADYIETAYSLGIVKGKSDRKFMPDSEITREEIASMISRLDKESLELRNVDSSLSKFKDWKTISSWAKEDVAKIVTKGIMTGKKEGFDPKANTTRAEATTIMYRIYDIY